jgi:Restriction endonuclease
VADEIKAVDLKLVGDLFGDGYVMDFTNRTYQEFFRDEVGIDIYNDAYLINDGNSKGKRLRAFMQKGQKAAIVKALHGLWEYRVAYMAGHEDLVPQGRERVSALIVRLGGKPIAGAIEPPQATSQTSAPSRANAPNEGVQAALEAGFNMLHAMDDAPHARGYAFEGFLKSWFDAWGLEARKSFRIGDGEQLDGSFLHRNSVFLIEAKWTNAPTDAGALHAFQGKVGERLEGARGLYVSYAGFTAPSLRDFTAKRILLMDGMDIMDALSWRLSLDEMIAAKLRIAIEERRPFVRVRELFP